MTTKIEPLKIEVNSLLELKALLRKKPLLTRADDIQKELAELTVEDKLQAADLFQELCILDEEATCDKDHAQAFVLARNKAKTNPEILRLLNFFIIKSGADKMAFEAVINLAKNHNLPKTMIVQAPICQTSKYLRQLLDKLMPDPPKKTGILSLL